MASSTPGASPDSGNPTRHSGRGFALKDPERQPEVTQTGARTASAGHARPVPGQNPERREQAAAAEPRRGRSRDRGR